MLSIYKSVDGKLETLNSIEKNSWINLIKPTEYELQYVMDALDVDEGFIRAALDDEEASRAEYERDIEQSLIVIDVPIVINENNKILYETIPVGIVVLLDNIITVCLEESPILNDFIQGRVKQVMTNHKTRFVFQILYRTAAKFLAYLRHINRLSTAIERELHKSMKNKELIQLLELEKSLVFFSTSLKSNQSVMEKLSRGRIVQLYEEDKELLEDVIIEFDQAIEMSNIYSNVLSGMMDAFASIISNNLNIVMKVLTAITILMAIPTMISGLYGMNVTSLPVPDFRFVSLMIVIITVGIGYLLYKKNMFS